MRNIVEYIFCVHTCSPRIILTDAWGKDIEGLDQVELLRASRWSCRVQERTCSKPTLFAIFCSPFRLSYLCFFCCTLQTGKVFQRHCRFFKAGINDQPDSDGDSWTVVVGQTLLTYNWVDNKVPRPSSWTLRWLQMPPDQANLSLPHMHHRRCFKLCVTCSGTMKTAYLWPTMVSIYICVCVCLWLLVLFGEFGATTATVT